MKTQFLAITILLVAACNVTAPDYGAAHTPPGYPRNAVPHNPQATALRERTAQLRAQLDAVDALANELAGTETIGPDGQASDSLQAAWSREAASGRALVASHDPYAVVTDSMRGVRDAQMDSLAALIALRHATFAERLRLAEVKSIDAKLTPAASFRFQGGRYSAIRVAPKDLDIHLHWKNQKGEKYISIGALKEDLEKRGEKVVMITNAGMYNPDNSPQGLFIEKGKQLVPLDTSKGPEGRTLNFFLMPNGVFYIGNDGPKVVTTEQFPASRKGIQFATQSGPMLVIDGNIHPKFTKGSTNTNIRSGVGVTENGQVIIAISDRPVNFYDFATLFKDALHCPNALYLDGAISQMYLPGSNRMDLGGDFGPILAITAK